MAEIFALARERQPQIGFTTVYRALVRLRDEGLVWEVSLPGADAAYFERPAEPHAHFRCTACGKIDDVPVPFGDDAIARVAARLGAQVTSSSVALAGRCAACAATDEGSSEPLP